AALKELQDTIGDCVNYRKDVLARHLPPPPAPWRDIYAGFAEIDAAFDQAGFLNRMGRLLRTPMRSAARWAPVTAAILVVCLAVYRFRQTPSVQAAELLRKAVTAADARPARPRAIEIRTRDRRMIRPAGSIVQTAMNAADAEAMRQLQARFEAAHYDWTDP